MLEAVDHLLHVKTPSSRYIGPNVQKDFKTALKVLQGEQVFEFKEGRKHNKASSNSFIALRNNPAGFKTWLMRRRKAAAIEAQLLASCLVYFVVSTVFTILGYAISIYMSQHPILVVFKCCTGK